MSAPQPSEQEHEPTLAETYALAKKAGEDASRALESGADKEETKAAVTASVEEQADEKNLSISKDDAGMIAESVIAGLDARGVFPPEEGGETVPPPGEAPSPPPEDSASTQPAGGEEPTPVGDDPPKQGKRKWSERFVGRT